MKKMKGTLLLLFIVFAFNACKKENKDIPPIVTPPIPPPTIINNPPVANAGADTIITLYCSQAFHLVLNGGNTTDPEGKLSTYTWLKIAGPAGGFILNPNEPQVWVKNLVPGEHAFELTVKDAGGISSKDTMLVTVKRGAVKEYNLNTSFNGSFLFINNNKIRDLNGIYHYYDVTKIYAYDFAEEFDIDIEGYGDTAELSDEHKTFFEIDNVFGGSIYGNCSVNLKQLLRNGGGAFNGTFTITGGTASNCDATILDNLAPLTVSGTLDVASKKVTLNIIGKVYF
jgi:hypothetical protein